MRIKNLVAGLLVVLAAPQALAVEPADVARHYAHLGHAVFEDALLTARELSRAVAELRQRPSPRTLEAARQTWIWARVPYSQSEVFRFGNANVDDWEGQVNAWPLDEGLIDYVASSYAGAEGNAYARHNVIAGDEPITADLLRSYQEKAGAEVNVAIGYHAIEFLLWGQDLNQAPSDSGMRPHTDFLTGPGCTHGNCERRGQYLQVAADLLVTDLEQMVAEWAPGVPGNHRAQLASEPPEKVLQRMLLGMAILSQSELAGERINVALLAGAQEEEQSCFSDNTHADIVENARGIENLFRGAYRRVDGSAVAGPGLSALLAERAPDLQHQLANTFTLSRQRAAAIADAARAGEHFDQQIAAGNRAGQERVRSVVRVLKQQGRLLHGSAAALGLADLRPL